MYILSFTFMLYKYLYFCETHMYITCIDMYYDCNRYVSHMYIGAGIGQNFSIACPCAVWRIPSRKWFNLRYGGFLSHGGTPK